MPLAMPKAETLPQPQNVAAPTLETAATLACRLFFPPMPPLSDYEIGIASSAAHVAIRADRERIASLLAALDADDPCDAARALLAQLRGES